jgi:dipeptidyl aminopeptidase/acylaminoacyl peptidase
MRTSDNFYLLNYFYFYAILKYIICFNSFSVMLLRASHFLIVFSFLASVNMFSQQKRTLSHADYDSWNELRSAQISVEGKWICYEKNPQQGDGWLCIYNVASGKTDSVPRGYDARFSATEEFLVFKIKPTYQQTRKAKLAKKKADDMPSDSLGIIILGKDSLVKIPEVKSYLLPEKHGNWLAVTLQKEASEKKTNDSVSVADSSRKVLLKKDKPEGTPMLLINPVTGSQQRFERVTEVAAGKNASVFGWISSLEDSMQHYQVNYFCPVTGAIHEILNRRGKAVSVVVSGKGNQLFFLFSADTAKQKIYALYGFNAEFSKLNLMADKSCKVLPPGWAASENFKPWFSDDESRLFFGIAPWPEQEPKDTLTDDEKASVDVWHWNDPLIQSQQKFNLDRDKKKSWVTLLETGTGKIIPLADTNMGDVNLPYKGMGPWALASTADPYLVETTWKSEEERDYELISMKDGKHIPLMKSFNGSVRISPAGKYVFWYDPADSNWYSRSIPGGKIIALTRDLKIPFYDEQNDLPVPASDYGVMGWTENDRLLFLYDRYDIWGFDPSGTGAPFNLTSGAGRKQNLVFRYLRTDPDEIFIKPGEKILFTVFNDKNKQMGIASMNGVKVAEPAIRFLNPKRYTFRGKAEKAEVFLWTKEDFNEFPDLHLSTSDMKEMKPISRCNPEKDSLVWGDVKLVHWTAFDGKILDGLLYLPENLDTSKLYPMLVYFYERNSDLLYSWSNPAPSRSTINRPYCVSNGYVVFVPDITYETGYPGRSAFNAVVSGTMAMLGQFPFIDKNRLGMNGQSWGGYQVAWLVTRTDIFRCAMAGAPVSNMTSAYGGIRWESGKSRMFQYEEAQSRIGGTLWERPFLYLENSPLFSANTIHTPLLIMHNDADGAVPWYQGIELYMALRRLQKPCWMLSYNNEQHNLTRRANMKDLSIRMMQFYDYYLQGKPMPEWMSSGIPAIEKGNNKGY